jgi:hypothetical protein
LFESQISARTPPVAIIGAAPKNPQKKRVMRTVCISFADAVAKENIAAMKQGAIVGHFLPYISDNGAQTSGPNPNLYWLV